MKRFLYFCGMMLISLNMMAQIDLDDDNWECFINENFSGVRYWDGHWEDQKDTIGYKPFWKCFADEIWGSGVTGSIRERHAYQRNNAVFDSNHTLRLIEELKSQSPLWCGEGYVPAPWNKYCHYCDSLHENQHPCVHYHTGMIESIDPVGYGYYEIECKMPLHEGAYSAFWFWSGLGQTYNEIDVFEHTKALCPSNLNTETLSGIWFNPYGSNLHAILDEWGNTVVPAAVRYSNHLYAIPENGPSLDEYHTFGCLWLPNQVAFYVDGRIVNEFDNPELIPPHPMWLKITHTEDIDAKVGFDENLDTIWGNWNDEMTINYIKGYRLKADCSADVVIRNLSDFNGFQYKTKHTITMGGQNSTLTIPVGRNFTMRAVESIVIDGPFELPLGTQMTLMTHDCPECSMEGVVLPQHNCPE
jgi:hypothetical protein